MDKALEQLIEAVKQASPMLWAAAQAKVSADLSVAHFWAWAGVGLLIVGIVLLSWVQWNDSYSDIDGAEIVGVILLCFGIPMAAIAWTMYFQIGMARDWYTIKALVELSPLK